MKKTIIKRTVLIDTPVSQVWDVLADFGNIQNLSPNVVKSYLTSDQQTGVGTTRHCDFATMGAQVEERIVEWQEGKSMKIDIYASKNLPMMTGMVATFELVLEGNKTKLVGTFEYSMTNAIGGLMNNLAMKKANTKAWNLALAGIKRHCETGEPVDKSTKLDLSVVEE